MIRRTLHTLLDELVDLRGTDDVVISGLAEHSKAVQPGNLYLAVKGHKVHGMDFFEAAITNGAAVVAYDPDGCIPPADTKVPVVAVPDLNRKVGIIADRFYSCPSETLQVIAVTGTNGKTSTAYLSAQSLKHHYGLCGLFGTLGYGEFNDLKPALTTTPSALRLHAEMYALVCAGVTHTVMEASSHGLDQGRLAGVNVNVAVLTMLGRDHFDYHGSLEAYKAAKRKLFELPNLQWIVLNVDDEFGRELEKDCTSHCQVIRYSSQNNPRADLSANNIVVNADGLHFEVRYQGQSVSIHSRLLGRFNVDSLLATFAVLLTQGISTEVIGDLLNHTTPVPGRMQSFSMSGFPCVILDYAHTPEALEQVLQACREMTAGKLHCVFGCGGNRDQGKRRLMGKAASSLADRVTLTDDNPRNENPKQIVADILSGIVAGAVVEVEHNRECAIRRAINDAHADDYVLVAGKGSEDYQLVGGKKLPMSDLNFINKTFSEKRHVVA